MQVLKSAGKKFINFSYPFNTYRICSDILSVPDISNLCPFFSLTQFIASSL